MRYPIIILLLVISTAAIWAVRLPDGTRAIITEAPVMKLPAFSDPVFSTDGIKVALLTGEKQRYLLYNGKKYGPYDFLLPMFSPAGKHLAAITGSGETVRLLIDGVTQQADSNYAFYSKDDEHLAYVVGKDGQMHMRIDGKDGPSYQDINPLSCSWSSSGKHFIYVAEKGGHAYLVVDGVQGKEEFDPNSISASFSPNEQHLSVFARRGGKGYLFVDGIQQAGPYAAAKLLQFSPDTKRVAIITGNHTGQIVVVDGVDNSEYKEVTGFVFNATGEHYAYAAQLEPRKGVVVMDGTVVGNYPLTFWPTFSPDGKRLGYFVWAPKEGNDRILSGFAVIDNKATKTYSNVRWSASNPGIIFSADSQRWAFPAEKTTVVTSEGEYQHLDSFDLEEDSIAFSPDSKHLVYFIRESGGMPGDYALYVDGMRVTGVYDYIYTDFNAKFPIFSAANKRLSQNDLSVDGAAWFVSAAKSI